MVRNKDLDKIFTNMMTLCQGCGQTDYPLSWYHGRRLCFRCIDILKKSFIIQKKENRLK